MTQLRMSTPAWRRIARMICPEARAPSAAAPHPPLSAPHGCHLRSEMCPARSRRHFRPPVAFSYHYKHCRQKQRIALIVHLLIRLFENQSKGWTCWVESLDGDAPVSAEPLGFVGQARGLEDPCTWECDGCIGRDPCRSEYALSFPFGMSLVISILLYYRQCLFERGGVAGISVVGVWGFQNGPSIRLHSRPPSSV